MIDLVQALATLLASLIYIKHNRERKLVKWVLADRDQGARPGQAKPGPYAR
jgi:hypothetical protein